MQNEKTAQHTLLRSLFTFTTVQILNEKRYYAKRNTGYFTVRLTVRGGGSAPPA